MTKLIFGIGTGRCGTKSLCEFFNSQDNIIAFHESFVLPWEINLFELMVNINYLINLHDNYEYVCECSSFFLPYFSEILKIFNDTKFICLKRDRNDVIQSFIKKTQGRNHWVTDQIKIENNYSMDSKWDKCFPTYSIRSKENAIGKYWDDYYNEADRLTKQFPKNFAVFNTESLNTYKGRKKILDFIEYDQEYKNLENKNIFHINKGLSNTPKEQFYKKRK